MTIHQVILAQLNNLRTVMAYLVVTELSNAHVNVTCEVITSQKQVHIMKRMNTVHNDETHRCGCLWCTMCCPKFVIQRWLLRKNGLEL